MLYTDGYVFIIQHFGFIHVEGTLISEQMIFKSWPRTALVKFRQQQ